MHCHFRHDNEEMLAKVAPHTAKVCKYAVAMPNTIPPTISQESLIQGKQRIEKFGVIPLMMMKMESNCVPEMFVKEAIGTKSYPEGVTTNSERGLSVEILKNPPKNLKECWELQAETGMISSWHGEMPNSFAMNAEEDFLPFIVKLAKDYPKLKIVLEHITTAAAVDVVLMNKNIAATITYHHLKMTLDDVIRDKIRPHHYCKPIPKTPKDKRMLLNAAFSENPRFFLGSDSAPHYLENKECSHGCAGVYSSPVLAQGLVELFYGRLDILEKFACEFGPEYYNLPPITEEIELERREWQVPVEIDGIVPYHAGETLPWRLL
jgi:dihydroorotase